MTTAKNVRDAMEAANSAAVRAQFMIEHIDGSTGQDEALLAAHYRTVEALYVMADFYNQRIAELQEVVAALQAHNSAQAQKEHTNG